MKRLQPIDDAGDSPNVLEQETVSGLKAGDRRCLGLLVDKFGEHLMSYLSAILGKRDQAEDVFQDTWVRVMEHMDRFDASRSFSPWLFRIARNLAYDRLRRRRWESWLRLGSERGDDRAVEVAAPGDFREPVLARNMASALLAGLDPELREMIWMRFYRDMSYEEMAQYSGLPLGTIKSRLARALHQVGRRYRILGGVDHGKDKS